MLAPQNWFRANLPTHFRVQKVRGQSDRPLKRQQTDSWNSDSWKSGAKPGGFERGASSTSSPAPPRSSPRAFRCSARFDLCGRIARHVWWVVQRDVRVRPRESSRIRMIARSGAKLSPSGKRRLRSLWGCESLSCFMKVAGFRARVGWGSGGSGRLVGGRRGVSIRRVFGGVGSC